MNHLRAIVISIRNYLQVDRTTDDTLLQLAHLLMAGIDHHSVEGAPGELARVRESTQQVRVAVESHSPREEVLDQAERSIQAFRLHNQRAVEHLRRPVVELQARVNLLTEAITKVSGSSSENIRRLREIKTQVLSATDVREIRSYKLHMSECLDSILAQAERQRAEADRVAEQLNWGAPMLSAPDSLEQNSAIDPTTGLPNRNCGEESIAQACQDERHAFVVVMVVNQMQTLNHSFGCEFGDLVLRRFAAVLREHIPSVDPLFRWSGPTVVALVRCKNMLEVRGVVEPALLQRINVKATESEVLVPISTRWTVLPLMASPRLLFHKIDGFAQFD